MMVPLPCSRCQAKSRVSQDCQACSVSCWPTSAKTWCSTTPSIGGRPSGVSRTWSPSAIVPASPSPPLSTVHARSRSPTSGCKAQTGVAVRPGKYVRHWARVWRYMSQPRLSASYSASQSSPRTPLWTSRSTVPPWSRPSTIHSNAMNDPSGPSPRTANRFGGSQAVTVDSWVWSPSVHRTVPPSRGSTWLRPMNQESIPGPVAIASHTCSGVASRDNSLRSSNSWVISGLLGVDLEVVGRGGGGPGFDGGVDGDDHAVLPPTLGRLVVVPADKGGHRAGQLLRERCPVRRGGEPHHPVQRERRHRLAGLGRSRDQRADVAHELRGHRQQPAGRQPVRGAGRVRLDRSKHRRRDHVGRGSGAQQPFGAVALAALLDQLDQPMALQGAQMVVDLLPGQAEAGGEHGCRGGLGEFGQEPGPGRVQRGLGGGGVVDDGDIVHATTLAPTTFIVKKAKLVGSRLGSRLSRFMLRVWPVRPAPGGFPRGWT